MTNIQHRPQNASHKCCGRSYPIRQSFSTTNTHLFSYCHNTHLNLPSVSSAGHTKELNVADSQSKPIGKFYLLNLADSKSGIHLCHSLFSFFYGAQNCNNVFGMVGVHYYIYAIIIFHIFSFSLDRRPIGL